LHNINNVGILIEALFCFLIHLFDTNDVVVVEALTTQEPEDRTYESHVQHYFLTQMVFKIPSSTEHVENNCLDITLINVSIFKTLLRFPCLSIPDFMTFFKLFLINYWPPIQKFPKILLATVQFAFCTIIFLIVAFMHKFSEKFPIILLLKIHIFDGSSEIVNFCEVSYNEHCYTRIEAYNAANNTDLIDPVCSLDNDMCLFVINFQIQLN